jgi:SAM-dependent methyltransferase
VKEWLLALLRCPACKEEQPLTREGEALACPGCARRYPIVRGIPRFAGFDGNYAENFGVQWRTFRKTQIDRLAGHRLSTDRLFRDTRWPRESLKGLCVLDAGCGAGRFADVLAEAGARVVAADLSSAVEACAETAADPQDASPLRGDVQVVQADLLALPFRSGAFDAIHCAGVIQHTADPPAVMRALPALTKRGGRLFYNFYEIDPSSRFQAIKYLLRRWTPDWPVQRLHSFCRGLTRLFFPLSYVMSRIPVVRYFNRFLPICSTHPAGIPLKQQYEMTLLDTIDWYGPRYEIRQDHAAVAALLREIGCTEVESAPGRAWAIKS